MHKEEPRSFTDLIAIGVAASMKVAIEESRRWGMPLVLWDGEKIVKIMPDDLPEFKEPEEP